MTTPQPEKDWRNETFTYDRFFYQITLGVIVIIIAILIGFALFPEDMGYKSNLYTTAIGVLITISFLDLLNRRRDENNLKEQLKNRLVEDLGSTINQVACLAAEKLRLRGWLTDSTLVGADLQGANLEGAVLFEANLKDAHLAGANLKGALLLSANLENVDLGEKQVAIVNLIRVMMTPSAEHDELLQTLRNIEGTQELIEAIESMKTTEISPVLNIVKLTQFDENTLLPDGTHWKEDTDMRRFTNREHPDFWASPDHK